MEGISTTLLNQLAAWVGLDVSLIWMVLTLLTAALVFFALYSLSGIQLLSWLGVIALLAMAVLSRVVPFWFLALPLPGILFSFWCMAESEAPVYETGTVQSSEDRWESYGRRIKDAYSAKFGGDNPGFGEEIDKRINIMRSNGRGFTRKLASDWLKRMTKFTEAK
jgi:hypothetical protein